MVDINDYREERTCVYKGEEYLVRDNGAVLRKPRPNQRVRKLDNQWTFGKANIKTGYLEFSSERVNRIVAWAFHGEPPTEQHIADHIDTNRHNNRPSNLRWVTKFENAVLNETTRKKIEYRTGVSIYEFLENPSKYRDTLEFSDFSWMRSVTEEEAKACLDNIKRWGESKSKSATANSKIGDWIYQPSKTKYNKETNENAPFSSSSSCDPFESIPKIIDSLTPLAKQKDWKTLTRFICCPDIVEGNPIRCYIKNLYEGVVFSQNQYGESTVIKYASIDDNEIIIITAIPSPIKPYAVVKITFENGYYLHTSLGTFFYYEGAEQQFMIAQGLEWLGEDSLDDYC